MRKSLIILSALSLFPISWTIESIFQKRAIEAVIEDVSKKIEEPGFLVIMFGVRQPFREVYQVLHGRSVEDNDVENSIRVFRPTDKKDRTVVLRILGNNRLNWYRYTMRTCGDVYCPYSPRNLVPIPAVSKADATEIHSEREEYIKIRRHKMKVEYKWAKTELNDLLYAYVSISAEIINPIDRTFRQFAPELGLNEYRERWHKSIDIDFLEEIKH